MRPALVAPANPPVKTMTLATAGSSPTIFAYCSSRSRIAWNELDWSAVIEPNMRTRILLGEEALRDDDVEVNAEADRRQGHQEHQRLMPQHPAQRGLVPTQEPQE